MIQTEVLRHADARVPDIAAVAVVKPNEDHAVVGLPRAGLVPQPEGTVLTEGVLQREGCVSRGPTKVRSY